MYFVGLGVAALTFWFLTIGTSLADWGVGVPIGHPRFCEKQEIRVSRIADNLIVIILDVNVDTSMTGTVSSDQSWEWKKQILSHAGRIDQTGGRRGIECAKFADELIRIFEEIYQEVLAGECGVVRICIKQY